MKLIKTLTYVVILSLSFASYAEAKGKSFGGGFRSQRTVSAPRPAPKQVAPATNTQSKSIFGSFGSKSGTSGTAAKNAQPLNMSKDMNSNAAQGNALKTADGRAVPNQAAAGSGSGWFGSGGAAKPAGAMPSGAQPAAVRQGGGFMNNAMWFMLGSSLASHGRAAPAAEQNPEANAAQQNSEQHGQIQAPAKDATANDTGITDPAIIAAPLEEKESFFMSLLRIILWGGIFYGIYKLATTLMRPKASAAKKSNYTFGNN